MIAISECAPMIDPDLMALENIHWLYYSCWVGSNSDNSSEAPKFQEFNTEKSMLRKIYNSEGIVTLKNLSK